MVCLTDFTWCILVELDDDELRCLRLLRDRVIDASVRASRGGHLSHSQLMSILCDIRDGAQNKATWEEAIQSAGGRTSAAARTHSVSAISNAIKVMLEDYLGSIEEEQPAVSPRVDAVNVSTITMNEAKEEALTVEIDVLRSKLTESECKSAQLSEDNARLVKELSDSTSRLSKQTSFEDQSREILDLKHQLEAARATVSKHANESDSRIVSLQEEVATLRARLARIEIPLDSFSPSDVPSLEEWQLTLSQVNHLRQLVGEDKSMYTYSLLSQIQTLEVQKSDAEAELTRLKAAMKSSSPAVSTSAPSVASFNRFSNTISVHGLGTPSRRSSVAEQFVDLPTKAAKRSSSKRNGRNDQCIQQ